MENMIVESRPIHTCPLHHVMGCVDCAKRVHSLNVPCYMHSIFVYRLSSIAYSMHTVYKYCCICFSKALPILKWINAQLSTNVCPPHQLQTFNARHFIATCKIFVLLHIQLCWFADVVYGDVCRSHRCRWMAVILLFGWYLLTATENDLMEELLGQARQKPVMCAQYYSSKRCVNIRPPRRVRRVRETLTHNATVTM